MKTTFTTLKGFEQKAINEVIKYAVSRQMFCPVTSKVLDCRSAIFAEYYEGEKVVVSQAFHSSVKNVMSQLEEKANGRGYTIKWYKSRKVSGDELLSSLEIKGGVR